ncbi:MAG: Protein kinase [Claussenomyces sp. TS43310]|nr:MAG: Protein kinase [Claussenomyces sp. TS43310]
MSHHGYDDEELSISVAPSNNRRTQNKAPDARSNIKSPGSERKPLEPVPQKADQRIGAYHIIRTLGEGSFGKVKLAVHRVTQQQVALKIIARKKLISRDMAGRVEREIEYLQLLRHPHIIKLYTVIKTQQEIIMVLEYAGGELFDYIVQHGKMQEDKARRFFQQIICAVEYCHRHKIVHRDLKPENLLLDENLNVKIADFGLSNIMTDGNFLKTSCGSPNYAAPEVINGKLYAGPEVDVWSCGVILYVLLVGRLPFDDEHIPSLFAKIAKGHYVVPNYMSQGASSLIKKMLAVNPVYRATIEEIRQDPWFLVNLPAYLKPPVEEFIDTGVDPSKAINIQAIAPGASLAVQEQLHNAITDKIQKTMGYGKKDVLEALEADEPSAIKDAYLIVRENKLMEANPNLGDVFTPSSPPFDPRSDRSQLPGSPLGPGADKPSPPGYVSTITNTAFNLNRNEARSPSGRSEMTNNSASTDRSAIPNISKIGILPSSLPAYHRDYMEARKAGSEKSTTLPPIDNEHHEHKPSGAEQAETARRLKPHSRSQMKLDEASKKPAGMTPVPIKKSKPTKWQFGIRSRNQPLEAIGCIYRALQKLGAEWVADEEQVYKAKEGEQRERNNGESFLSLDSEDGGPLHHVESIVKEGNLSNGIRFTSRDPNASYKLPADPWVLRVRWRKSGMYPPGTVPPGSTHSSQADLRRQSMASLSSTSGSAPSHDAGTPPSHTIRQPQDSVVVHLDIQLYEMEPGVYLVDFKCAGYETTEGLLVEEKDVTSPFPFLDLASRLIIQLAEAD